MPAAKKRRIATRAAVASGAAAAEAAAPAELDGNVNEEILVFSDDGGAGSGGK